MRIANLLIIVIQAQRTEPVYNHIAIWTMLRNPRGTDIL